MVTIIYYKDPLKPATETVECGKVSDFLLRKFNNRDELLDLRFFDTEILSHEIDQSNGEFLDIDEGTVAITHDSAIPRGPETWIYLAIAAVVAVAAVILLRPEIPQLEGRDQKSSTNSLGSTQNEPRINQRIDDIFGRVNRHTPPLWQVPYRIGTDNEECEVLLVAVGRGKYQIHEWYDGDTPVNNIPNAAVSIYGPGTYPGYGSPVMQIGPDITEPIGIYRQSNDLNPAELAPPNDRDNIGVLWKLTGSGLTATLTAVVVPDGFDLIEFYTIGDEVTFNEMYYLNTVGFKIFYKGDFDILVPREFLVYDNPVDLGQNKTLFYTVTGVTSTTLTLAIPGTAPTEVLDAWDSMTDYFPSSNLILIESALSPDIFTEDEQILYDDWYEQETDGLITADVAVVVGIFIIDDITPERLEALRLYPDTASAGVTLRVIIDSQSIDEELVIQQVTPFGSNWSIQFTTLPATAVSASNVPMYILRNGISGLFRVTASVETQYPTVGVPYDNTIGPIRIPDGATEVLLNFVSPSGFYKLRENNEVKIVASIEITFSELDTEGDETGMSETETVIYSSNDLNTRQSVFKSVRLTLPYSRNNIRVKRLTDRDKSTNISNVDNIEWRDLYTFQPVGFTLWESFIGGTFVLGGLFAIDNVTLEDLNALGLEPGLVNAGQLISVRILSQGIDTSVTIRDIQPFGSNYSIYSETVPVGAITASGVAIELSTGRSNLNFGDVTLAQILIPSNSQSRLVKQRKQNCDLTRLITQYLGNGEFGTVESYATDEPDQIMIHTALDNRIGRLQLSNINADGFLALKDENISYFGSDEMWHFGYNFDTTQMTYQDTFMLICDVIMCNPFVQSGVYDAFFEKSQTVSSMQITCRNKLPNSESRKTVYDRKYDGVEVSYRDNETGVSETVYIPVDQSATNPQMKELPGCTSKIQAYRYAWRLYNKQLFQTDIVKFDIDEFGRNVLPGKRLDSPDSSRFTRRPGVTDGYRVYDGEVVEVEGLTVELSEPVYFTPGEDHYIVFTQANGENSNSILCTQVDDYRVLLSLLPAQPIYDGYSMDRTKYTLMSEQLRQSVALLPQTIEFSLTDDNQEVHTVTSINYTDKYYQNDLDTPE